MCLRRLKDKGKWQREKEGRPCLYVCQGEKGGKIGNTDPDNTLGWEGISLRATRRGKHLLKIEKPNLET